MWPQIRAAQREFFVTRVFVLCPDRIKERKEECRYYREYHRNNNAIVVLNSKYIPHRFTVTDLALC